MILYPILSAFPQEIVYRSFFFKRYGNLFKNKKVLDIGSLDINGSNRFLFEDCNYLGIDVGEGKNVDFTVMLTTPACPMMSPGL